MTTSTLPPPTRSPGRPWPVAEAAEFLNVSRQTLMRLAEVGRLRIVRLGLGRGRIVVPDREVRRLAEGR